MNTKQICQDIISAASPAQIKTVLVVDDDSRFRDLIASILCPAGYHVDEAEDGMGAMIHAHKDQIDLLITDLVMPNAEGLETLRYFSKHFPAMPVVAVSGSRSYLEPAKALGAVATIEKTKVFEDLLGVVRQAIGE
jgi:DNA-binding NtrC family response regulator